MKYKKKKKKVATELLLHNTLANQALEIISIYLEDTWIRFKQNMTIFFWWLIPILNLE